MGLFGSGGSKLPKDVKPYVMSGLNAAQSTYNENQPNLTRLAGIASDAAGSLAGKAFGDNPFVDNAQGAARTISNGYFLGSNPGQATYDRLQQTGMPAVMPKGMFTGSMPAKQPTNPYGQAGTDASMGLLSGIANDTTPGAGNAALTRLMGGGSNPGDAFASAVAQGQYLNGQPSAGLYGEMMDRSYSTSNPFLEDIIRQNADAVTTAANRRFAAGGSGIGSAFADVLSRNLADSGNQLRYQNYSDAENRRLAAAGQSDAAFSAERGRMDNAAGLLSSNYNAGQERALAAAQALNSAGGENADRRLAAAQALGGQFTDTENRNAGLYTSDANRAFDRYRTDADRNLTAFNTREDRALEAAKSADASQSMSVSQILQALGLTGQLTDAEYAGVAPTNQLLSTAATLPYVGLDAYQTAISNLANTTRKTSGPGIGTTIAGGLAQGVGTAIGAAAMASDRRLKTDIVKVGEFDDGLGVYDFNYIDSRFGEGRHRGVMADEVAQLRPWALGPLIDGEYASVNYGVL